MDLKLNGKVAMVAASSKGLGYGIAQALAQEGASISIGSRTEADIESAAEQLRKETGVPVLASVLDSSNSESIQQWFRSRALAILQVPSPVTSMACT